MRGSRGFSLIEIMVVLGIMAALVVLGASRIQKKQTSIRSVVRQFTVLGKEIRNHARLHNQTLRLVIELDPEKPTYFIEASNSSGSNYIDAEALEKLRSGDLREDDPDRKNVTAFTPYTRIMKKPRELPSGFFFKQVETQSSPDPITEGKAYIYFFPKGHLEATAIQMSDGKDTTWTIVYHPLTGHANIIQEAQSLRDIKR